MHRNGLMTEYPKRQQQQLDIQQPKARNQPQGQVNAGNYQINQPFSPLLATYSWLLY